MKIIERVLIRILLIQFILLCIVQILFMQESMVRYVSKIVYYEGVIREKPTDTLQVNK
ncbi:DUF5359 family protein [Bacillus gaemokensis]|uniref:DUF5359 family protein n=1 Tax=Bacillus gaemokensis TaxID=574375 RepID=UPI000A70A349|nr:DUF5359 family protein [Bacillus gaemokensis]